MSLDYCWSYKRPKADNLLVEMNKLAWQTEVFPRFIQIGTKTLIKTQTIQVASYPQHVQCPGKQSAD